VFVAVVQIRHMRMYVHDGFVLMNVLVSARRLIRVIVNVVVMSVVVDVFMIVLDLVMGMFVCVTAAENETDPYRGDQE